MIMVFASGMSRPFSTIVVETRMSYSWRMKRSIVRHEYDNRGGNQNVVLVAHEAQHRALQFLFTHLAVTHTNAGLRHKFLEHRGPRPDGINAIVDEVHLSSAIELELER